jgi:hypothetical protein
MFFRKSDQYFEFNMDKKDKTIIVEIRDITEAMVSQQDYIDRFYQEALHANFSHEQMTPLNNI